eukprot:TRINITY_DN4227_c0_g4_i2.p1 TRINITY_DN4227_c0_g4~~TRINITY_DN4227_c0_g4_i2.p1  ORF type:complete len:575 (+),score=141.43 TRINITY_DN4227_c0_g4_i2:217-1941(+)
MLFEDLGQIILNNAYEGYNCTLLAYGASGSGKTYTMMGDLDSPDPEELGIIPRICCALFDSSNQHKSSDAKTLDVSVSYFEIYDEKIWDLLSPENVPLKIREHPQTGPFVEGLASFSVKSFEEISELIERGTERRRTGDTKMNDRSSRSHAIFSIKFAQAYSVSSGSTVERVSIINLVDLAGAERQEKTKASGTRLKESCNINTSLTVLGRVIRDLSKRGHSNSYRDSKLTYLLKDSLGGNAKTIMLATISPLILDSQDALNTLQYAQQATQIVNRVHVNEDPLMNLIKTLKEENSFLKEEVRKLMMERSDFLHLFQKLHLEEEITMQEDTDQLVEPVAEPHLFSEFSSPDNEGQQSEETTVENFERNADDFLNDQISNNYSLVENLQDQNTKLGNFIVLGSVEECVDMKTTRIGNAFLGSTELGDGNSKLKDHREDCIALDVLEDYFSDDEKKSVEDECEIDSVLQEKDREFEYCTAEVAELRNALRGAEDRAMKRLRRKHRTFKMMVLDKIQMYDSVAAKVVDCERLIFSQKQELEVKRLQLQELKLKVEALEEAWRSKEDRKDVSCKCTIL